MFRIYLSLVFLAFPASAQEPDFASPTNSEEDLRVFQFSIPAPRGLITDRHGEPLAYNEAVSVLGLNLVLLADEESDDPPVSKVLVLFKELEKVEQLDLKIPDKVDIVSHWKHRRFLPIIISGPDSKSGVVQLFAEKMPFLSEETRYQRRYVGGEAFSHIIGYVRPAMPDQYGPLNRGDSLWPPKEAVTGLEKSFSSSLTGIDGKTNLLHGVNGVLVNREISLLPRPGGTVVTTLNLEMQKLAWKLLKQVDRPGAFVAVDSRSGDILAMASYPAFRSDDFVNGISSRRYTELRDNPNAPLFNRAVQGGYPPGSTFKPFVALAALDSGAIGIPTHFESPPSLSIDGRDFHNWNKNHEGNLDVRYALMRSSNTWFYQAGIETGYRPIIDTAGEFGFGLPPDIPLANVAEGNLPNPETYMVRQGVANLSIGQGEVLASPLQLAKAMSGLAQTDFIAQSRLVIQIQTPLTHEPVKTFLPEKAPIPYRLSDVKAIRSGMLGVVNHPRGTGLKASNERPIVYGKTGTSQWSNNGKEHPLVWFAGFTGPANPRIAFAVMLQGEPDEKIYGGSHAAPLVGQFLKEIYAQPDKFHVTVPDIAPNYTSILESMNPKVAVATPVAAAVPVKTGIFRNRSIKRIDRPSTRNRKGSIFKKLFRR